VKSCSRASFGPPFTSFVIAVWRTKEAELRYAKYWEIIADKLSKAGWSLGWVSAIDSEGRTIWIVRSDEKLAAFLELERITHEIAVSTLLGDDPR
jgi:hypothetical protein